VNRLKKCATYRNKPTEANRRRVDDSLLTFPQIPRNLQLAGAPVASIVLRLPGECPNYPAILYNDFPRFANRKQGGSRRCPAVATPVSPARDFSADFYGRRRYE